MANATAPRDRTRTTQVVGTPREFIRAVEAYRGPLFCDVAATSGNAKAPWFIADPKTADLNSGEASPFAPHPRQYGIDALTTDWPWPPRGEWNWLNPEFSSIALWLNRLVEQRKGRIQVLVPAAVGTNWYRDLVQGKAAVDFLSPRMTFIGHTDPYPKDLMLLAYDWQLLDCGLLNTQPKQWRWK